jgi:hypothetical protein
MQKKARQNSIKGQEDITEKMGPSWAAPRSVNFELRLGQHYDVRHLNAIRFVFWARLSPMDASQGQN